MLLSLITALYAFFVMRVMKIGFFNKNLFTSKKDMENINTTSYVFPLVFALSFMIADTIVWFVRWDVAVILLSLGFKIITYKVYEIYYISKAKKVFNEIHRYYPSYHGTYILHYAWPLIPIAQIVFLYSYFSWYVYIFTCLECIIMMYLYRVKKFQQLIYSIKIVEGIALLTVFLLMYQFGHPLMYAAAIGILVLL